MVLPAQAPQENTHEATDFAACLRQALDFMHTPQGDPAHVILYGLALVQRIADRLDGLPAVCLHQHALDCLLVAFISGGLAHHRRIMNLPLPSGGETHAQAQCALARDARCGGRELLRWDLLYYRYARVDLDFADEELSRIVNLGARSLRRYRQVGIQRLADWLLRAELHLRAGGLDATDPPLAALIAHDSLHGIIDLGAVGVSPAAAAWGAG